MENTYIINGTEYWVDEFEPGWGWASSDSESEGFYTTHNEALQACMDYVSQKEDEPMSEEDKIANAADAKNDLNWEDAL